MPRYVFLFYVRNYDRRYFRRRFNILETQSYDALETYMTDAVFGPLRNPPPPRPPPPPPPQAPPPSPEPHRGDSDADDDDDDGEVCYEIDDIPVVVNDGLEVPDGDGGAAPPEPIIVIVGRRRCLRILRSFYYNYHENFYRQLRNENFVTFRHTVAAIYAFPDSYLT